MQLIIRIINSNVKIRPMELEVCFEGTMQLQDPVLIVKSFLCLDLVRAVNLLSVVLSWKQGLVTTESLHHQRSF